MSLALSHSGRETGQETNHVYPLAVLLAVLLIVPVQAELLPDMQEKKRKVYAFQRS